MAGVKGGAGTSCYIIMQKYEYCQCATTTWHCGLNMVILLHLVASDSCYNQVLTPAAETGSLGLHRDELSAAMSHSEKSNMQQKTPWACWNPAQLYSGVSAPTCRMQEIVFDSKPGSASKSRENNVGQKPYRLLIKPVPLAPEDRDLRTLTAPMRRT